MSRQIYFIQSEPDIAPFVSEIYTNGWILESTVYADGRILESRRLSMDDGVQFIIENMKERYCTLTIIPPVVGPLLEECRIEYYCSVRGNMLSRTYREGRLYITENLQGHYDPNALELYQRLRKYIKKNYIYHKAAMVYFAPVFWNERAERHWVAADTIWRVIPLDISE